MNEKNMSTYRKEREGIRPLALAAASLFPPAYSWLVLAMTLWVLHLGGGLPAKALEPRLARPALTLKPPPAELWAAPERDKLQKGEGVAKLAD